MMDAASKKRSTSILVPENVSLHSLNVYTRSGTDIVTTVKIKTTKTVTHSLHGSYVGCTSVVLIRLPRNAMGAV